ncbi:MAG TPA: hypothetical protein VF223_23365 [Trebonia sp.]
MQSFRALPPSRGATGTWLDAAEGRLRRALAGGWTPAQATAAAQTSPRGAYPTQDGSQAMTVLELRSVSKVYGRGAAEVRALR